MQQLMQTICAKFAVLLLGSLPVLSHAAQLTCYSTAFPPYVIQSATGEISGIDVDTASLAATRAGIDLRIKLLPWVRLENELKRGAASEIECAFAYTRNPVRETYMDFMQVPLKMTRYLIFVNKNSQIHGLHDLKNKNLGLRRGFVVPGAFEEMRKRNEFNVEEVDDDVSNFRKLALQRLHAIIANADVGRQALAQLPQHEIIALEPALVETPTFLVLNKGKKLAHWLPALDKALADVQRDGSYQKIRAKYMQENAPK